ncbi:hypothetical protein HZH66_010854 [Vespula vulgaris]|uniref:Uncharacterized protein n=1 Tax=Vespula vulgaris TaxID=7454 RepID=A0A834JHQ3_VESVU|nr:hypothetical protein HZH66_010854 [Vespula vulgaris]
MGLTEEENIRLRPLTEASSLGGFLNIINYPYDNEFPRNRMNSSRSTRTKHDDNAKRHLLWNVSLNDLLVSTSRSRINDRSHVTHWATTVEAFARQALILARQGSCDLATSRYRLREQGTTGRYGSVPSFGRPHTGLMCLALS